MLILPYDIKVGACRIEQNNWHKSSSKEKQAVSYHSMTLLLFHLQICEHNRMLILSFILQYDKFLLQFLYCAANDLKLQKNMIGHRSIHGYMNAQKKQACFPFN